MEKAIQSEPSFSVYGLGFVRKLNLKIARPCIYRAVPT